MSALFSGVIAEMAMALFLKNQQQIQRLRVIFCAKSNSTEIRKSEFSAVELPEIHKSSASTKMLDFNQKRVEDKIKNEVTNPKK